MFLSPYFNKKNQVISVSRTQASTFAKHVAQDFNPIHDVNAKRFCVPGDLLFALVLTEYGLSQKMTFNFAGMVGDHVPLAFSDSEEQDFDICDEKEKCYLKVHRSGETTRCLTQTEAFIRSYVAFSGLNFIHVLVPMMKAQGVMVNPARPLIIYESMSVDLHTLVFSEVTLNLVKQYLKIDGKRGDVTLNFELHCGEQLVGTGEKTLVLSGLRAIDEELMQKMCDQYEGFKLAVSA
ncbi:DUF3581 domain-containing protein [Shewanella surugensis]|uniref:DUF3581 domain-containing protein n=1 Tax=Shewanella surugensis TaxID=212020 RepID=A0ABT0LAA2_9GAMM|nr:DUF3581 domain-containing protein [Shewanella surugensis]MCL1124285.1 DUF3581 domain-containing protein [Shewanella surugensis]